MLLAPSAVESSDGDAPWRNPRFHRVRALGHGGFGDVFLVHDAVRGHAVALKMLRGFGDDADRQLRSEFRRLKDFDHPGLVELHELHIDADASFFTMEFVRGVEITDYVDRGPAHQRHERALACLVRLVDAVAALHARGVVHRDLKPSNVLVTDEGRVVILDAGLARSVDSHHSSERYFAGTALYCAPEQALGATATPAADWYSVGAIAYELFAHRPPFDGDALTVIQHKINGTAPPLRDRAPDVDPELAELVDGFLARAPEARPAAGALERWIARHISDRATTATRLTHANTPFVGRLDALAELDRRLSDATGSASYLAVVGPSGIGKTALLSEWLVRLGPRDDTCVLRGRCYQRESTPYNGFDEVFDALRRALAADDELPTSVRAAAARVPGWALEPLDPWADTPPEGAAPAAPRPDPLERRRVVVRAIVDVMVHAVGHRRFVLWLDDVQWGPGETAFLLAEIGRAPWPRGALVALTHRPPTSDDGPCLAILREIVRGVESLPLRPLHEHEARAVVANTSVALTAEAAERLVTEGGGHPLLLTQAARFDADRAGAEPGLTALLRRRIAGLEPLARGILTALCVARTPLAESVALAAAMADADTAAIRHAEARGEARRLLAVGLIRRGGATGHLLLPFHDVLREVATAELDAAELRSWNLRIARALEALGHVEPEVLVDYVLAADERARAYQLVREAAAQMDRAFAFDRAAALCRLGLELAIELDPDRVGEARLRLAEALVNSGRCADAARLFQQAADDAADDDDANALRGRAALELIRGGYIEEGLEQARHTFRRLGIRLSRTSLRALPSIAVDRLRLRRRGLRYALTTEGDIAPDTLRRIDWCLTVGTVLPVVDTLRGFQVHNQGLRWALDAGEPTRLARVLAMEAGYRHVLSRGRGGAERAAALLDNAQWLAQGTGDPMAQAVVELMRGSGCWSTSDWPGCVAAMTAGTKLLRERCRGASWEINFAMTHMLDALMWMGHYDAHERAARMELEDAIARGDRYARTMYLVRDLRMNGLVRDDLDAAEARAAGAIEALEGRGYQVENLAELYELNHFALYRGQPDVGYALFHAQWRAIEGAQLLRLKPLRIESYSGRGRAAVALAVALPAGRRRERLVREAARCAERMAREAPDGRSLVLGGAVAAGVAYARGDAEGALARLEQGAADAAAWKMAPHEQAFRYLAARLRGGEGAAAEAAGALASLTELGLTRPKRYLQVLVTGFGDVV